jgi:hypothetical protein
VTVNPLWLETVDAKLGLVDTSSEYEAAPVTAPQLRKGDND